MGRAFFDIFAAGVSMCAINGLIDDDIIGDLAIHGHVLHRIRYMIADE